MKQIKTEARWKETFKVAWPLCLSYTPIGLACGILLHAAGFNTLLTGLVSLVIFSGGAQFLIAQMLTVNAPILTIVLMLFFLELRYALLGSSLSKYLQGESRSSIFTFALSLNDENYAVNYLKFATDKHWTPNDARQVEHWSLLFWTVSNIVGSLIGSVLSINLTVVDFALTALFIYMIVMQIKSRLSLLICIFSGALAAVCMIITKSTLGLVASTLIASFTGFLIEELLLKKRPASALLQDIGSRKGGPIIEEIEKKESDIL
ncbi:branched-chain amino acid ABC transporter permease [Pediococcus pentosaceus]|uniref:AzlC family ABC transporter permease n=1 Tax=Pediococcus pentosaceus TaxID=1255 RepID=UPI00132343EA|nr:AzlC family ABC transporter permease [Pediococcus pentosaceus]KAF0395016.1 branched-chain amino acid ABC transporter permease [Pediococcus pentosaceus]KAF0434762.1 branched-chain amino acid ABC transporter permease [Pediococcus pentosaceus]KAF0443100.1 branched-chain amino acid ABC transporter permease [Pediococcus pentosaceus]MBF7108175.1 AzlC family ABC transporter permease [Pediococcus pentosaceus]